MDKILLHPLTRRQLTAFIKQPAGTVLLTGPAGSGKLTVANALISQLLSVDTSGLRSHPHFIRLSRPDGKTEIPIDDVRDLIKKLKLKVPDAQNRQVNRAVLIEDAHYLSGEAQNALLKLLEEPPAATVILLSAVSEDRILPTVVSRSQRIMILMPSLDDSLGYYQAYPKQQVETNWRLSRGAAGLLAALLSDEAHPLKTAVESAKKFLAQDQYQRLLSMKQFGNKESLGLFLDSLSRVLAALQAESIKKGQSNQTKLLNARRLVDKLVAYHENNVSSRLIGLVLASELTL